MMRKARQYLQRHRWVLLAFFLFSLLNALTMCVQGDDYIWNFAYEWEEFERYRMPNGRYLGNILSYLLVRYPLVRYVLCTLILFAFLWCITAILERTKVKWNCGWLVLGLVLVVPPKFYMSGMHWLSAFPNYLLSFLFPMCFLLVCFRDEENPSRGKVWLLPLMLLCGVAGTLCLESGTIYQCILAVAMLVKGWVERKKPQLYRIVYLLGVAIGTVLMFTNHNYYAIAEGVDNAGYRYFEFDPSTIFMHIYKTVILWFAKPYFMVHLLIALSCWFLYTRADKQGWDAARKRYAVITSVVILCYAAYSTMIATVTNLISLTWNMRVPALETAFAFLYVISLLYQGYLLFDKAAFSRLIIFLCSAIINAGMFCMVGPANMRCFYHTFCFWVLVAGLFVCTASKGLTERWQESLNRLVGVAAVTVACFVGYCMTVNRVAECIRNNYLRQQIAEGKKRCEVIELPYGYTDAVFFLNPYQELKKDADDDGESTSASTVSEETVKETKEKYYRCMIAYWGFDVDLEEFNPYYITLLNYYT